MDRIRERLAIGRVRYGHGVRVNDDTTTWGTRENSWMEMADEELLDCLIYVVAAYIRETRGRKEDAAFEFEFYMRKDEEDDNSIILHILGNWNTMEPCRHKTLVSALFDMIQ